MKRIAVFLAVTTMVAPTDLVLASASVGFERDRLAQAGREQALGQSEGDGEGSQIPLEAIGGLLRTFIGSMVATQLGQSVGSLAASVTGAHDAGLPILEPARPVLIPENIAAWAADLEIPQSEVFIYHALRESAVARLFAHNPWLVSYIQSTITAHMSSSAFDRPR